MPLVIPGHKYKQALAKQTAEGTPASTAEYQVPFYSGPVKPQENRSNLEVADGNAFEPGLYKQQVWAEGPTEWMAFPTSLPRLVASHFGTGCDTVTGAGDPWTHTMVRKDTPLYHTHWAARPKTDGTFEWDKFSDCLAKSIEFRYTNGQLFRVATEPFGKKATGNATAPTITNTDVYDPIGANGQGYTWKGATLNLDLAATPGVTQIRKLSSFIIHAGYDNMSFEWTDDIFPQFFDLGRWSLSFSASVVLQDWSEYNATFYGAAAPGANTDASPTTLNGSLAFTINTGPTANANRTCVITINYMQFMLGAPDADPAGGGITATLTGTLTAPASGDPLTVAVKNAVSAAYA